MGDRKSLEDETEYVKDLPGFEPTTPQFFRDPMIDKLLEIVFRLGGELWTCKDRQLVTEHLLATKGMVTPDLIETFQPDEEFKQKSAELRQKYVERVFGELYPDDIPKGPPV